MLTKGILGLWDFYMGNMEQCSHVAYHCKACFVSILNLDKSRNLFLQLNSYFVVTGLICGFGSNYLGRLFLALITLWEKKSSCRRFINYLLLTFHLHFPSWLIIWDLFPDERSTKREWDSTAPHLGSWSCSPHDGPIFCTYCTPYLKHWYWQSGSSSNQYKRFILFCFCFCLDSPHPMVSSPYPIDSIFL